MNMLFKPPNDEKVLALRKTMTARLWRKKPPKAGETFYAQTGYANDTRFAKLRVLDVWEWSGTDFVATDREKQEIGYKEGYENFDEFYDAYKSLNAHNWNDPKRTHYFIEFEVVENLRAA